MVLGNKPQHRIFKFKQVVAPVVETYLLLEEGGYVLLESGGKIILE